MGFARRQRRTGLDEIDAAIDWAPLAAWNAAIRPARRRIKKDFGTVKRHFGLARARCMGRPRASLQERLTFLACNLRRAANLLRRAAA